MYTTLVYDDDGYYCSVDYPYGRPKFRKPYEKSFDNFDDAVAAAKKTAKKTKEDVEIWTKSHVVQFPEPALEVVALADKKA